MVLINRLTLHHTLAGFALGLFFAVQTLFLLEKGIGLWHIGLLFGAFGATTALLELPLGALADFHGRVRVYGLSRLITLIGIVLAMMMDAFWGLFLAIVLLGVGRALDSGSIQAWQIDQLKAAGRTDDIPRAIARFHSATAVAIATGALLGGYLPEWLAGAGFWNARPTEWNLLAQALVTGVHLLLLGWLFKEGDPKADPRVNPSIRNQLHIALEFGVNNPRLRGLFISAFMVGLVLFSLEAYWQPRVTEIAPGTNYAVFGWLASGYFIAAAAGPMLLGWLYKHWQPASERLILIILTLMAPLLAMLALQTNLLGYAPTYLALMLVLSMINLPFEMTLAKEVPNEVRSTLFSVLSLALQAGGVAMAYGLSFCIRWIGIEGLWLGLAALLAFSGLGGLVKASVTRRNVPIPNSGGRNPENFNSLL